MLSRLYVKNVALISEADIEFGNGLNVLSGETGSGKSVILDSINFVLGSKADRTMIRYGEQEAFIRAEFNVDCNSAAAKILDEYDIETDGTILISRKLCLDGRGIIKINGNVVTVSMLKNVSQHLVDVHGQSEHFFLLSENNQLKVVDGLLGSKAEEIKRKLLQLIARKKEYKQQIVSLGGDDAVRARKLDLLEFQISEIESADVKPGEFEELKVRQNILINVEKILYSLNFAKSVLSDDGGCGDGLTSAVHELSRISSFDDKYLQLCSRLEGANAEVSDIAETISDIAENLSFNEDEAQYVEERLSLIKNLLKKYGSNEDEILSFKKSAEAERDALSDSAAMIEKITKEISVCDDEIFGLCKSLTALRKEAAYKFSQEVENELKSLNIPYAKFEIHFIEYDKNSGNLNSANGSDEVSFEFSANKGEPLKPLNKVISGGEMSRFMLALKTRLKNLNGISTYIFDEIDSGISGYTASTVVEKFIDISKNTQIIAVSHLPQICAASDEQFLIYKIDENGKTYTKVKRLDDSQKLDEIVRLTGSVSSETAKRHAEELLKQIKK